MLVLWVWQLCVVCKTPRLFQSRRFKFKKKTFYGIFDWVHPCRPIIWHCVQYAVRNELNHFQNCTSLSYVVVRCFWVQRIWIMVLYLFRSFPYRSYSNLSFPVGPLAYTNANACCPRVRQVRETVKHWNHWVLHGQWIETRTMTLAWQQDDDDKNNSSTVLFNFNSPEMVATIKKCTKIT